MIESDISKVLRSRHNSSEWIFVTQLKTATGGVQSYSRDGYTRSRFIDAFAMHLWPSKKFWRVAYEIKVSRTDFLKELKEPKKRAQAIILCNEFYFALAPGIFKEEDRGDYNLFEEGFMEIQDDGTIKKIIPAHPHAAFPMPDWFTASLLRNVRDEGWGKADYDSAGNQHTISSRVAEIYQPSFYPIDPISPPVERPHFADVHGIVDAQPQICQCDDDQAKGGECEQFIEQFAHGISIQQGFVESNIEN